MENSHCNRKDFVTGDYLDFFFPHVAITQFGLTIEKAICVFGIIAFFFMESPTDFVSGTWLARTPGKGQLRQVSQGDAKRQQRQIDMELEVRQPGEAAEGVGDQEGLWQTAIQAVVGSCGSCLGGLIYSCHTSVISGSRKRIAKWFEPRNT